MDTIFPRPSSSATFIGVLGVVVLVVDDDFVRRLASVYCDVSGL